MSISNIRAVKQPLPGFSPFALGISTPPSTSEWTVNIKKSADQDITNSTVLTNDSELFFAVTAEDAYLIELLIVYSANDGTTDYKFDLVVDSGSAYSGGEQRSFRNDNLYNPTNFSVNAGSTTILSAVACQGVATHVTQFIYVTLMAKFTATTNFRFRFANNTAGASAVSRTKAGSILRAKKVMP